MLNFWQKKFQYFQKLLIFDKMVDFEEKCNKISIVAQWKAYKMYFILSSPKISLFGANSILRQSDFFFGTEEVYVCNYSLISPYIFSSETKQSRGKFFFILILPFCYKFRTYCLLKENFSSLLFRKEFWKFERPGKTIYKMCSILWMLFQHICNCPPPPLQFHPNWTMELCMQKNKKTFEAFE